MKNKTNNFISKLEKILVDSELKKMIINKINFYSSNGKLHIHNDELYGSYINKCNLNKATPIKEFLEVKILDGSIVCNFSEYNNRKIVNISQHSLKGGYTRIYKNEINKEITYNNNNELYDEEDEKIYNHQNTLIYESISKKHTDFDAYPYGCNSIQYNSACFVDSFYLERKWYVSNGSVIKYNLSKLFMNEEDKVCENYLICPVVCSNGLEPIYKYEKLDKELFNSFMIGEININEVLLKNRMQKKYQKTIGSKI